MTTSPELSELDGHQLLFVGGLHRSGTTFIAHMLAGHPDASGLTNTGVFEDEGQHLQDVFPAANKYGGPGKFAFADEMHLVESDAGDPPESAAKARRLIGSWVPHWDMSRRLLVEKSPPNMLKARYLQALFPVARFIMVTRHPIAVSEATQRWSKTSRYALTAHWVKAHEVMRGDIHQLDKVMTVRYEDVVAAPQDAYATMLKWLELAPDKTSEAVKTGVNEKYFSRWDGGGPLASRSRRKATEAFASTIAGYGYSICPPYADDTPAVQSKPGTAPDLENSQSERD